MQFWCRLCYWQFFAQRAITMDINEHAPTRQFSRPLILLAADANLLFFSTLCSDISLLLMYATTIQHCLRMFTHHLFEIKSKLKQPRITLFPKEKVSIPPVFWPVCWWDFMHSAALVPGGCRCFHKSSTSSSVHIRSQCGVVCDDHI